MEIYGEKPLLINGKEYWSVRQFAKLTGREEASIRYLITHGNKIRCLKSEHFEGRPFINAEELFEYLFVPPGKPSPFGQVIEKFMLNDDNLVVVRFSMQGEQLVPVEERVEKCL
jgi:hypothetical protein